MELTYIGHSCFKLEDQGFTVIFDPYADGHVPGYGNIREKADLVLCSHEHADHNGRDTVEMIPEGKNKNRFVITDSLQEAVKNADLVIEAVVEQEDVKKEVFREISLSSLPFCRRPFCRTYRR